MTRDEAVCRALLAAFPDAGPASPEWYDFKDQQWEFLAALSAAGFAVVPIEPTDEMLVEGWLSGAVIEDAGDARESYRAMLAAVTADILSKELQKARP